MLEKQGFFYQRKIKDIILKILLLEGNLAEGDTIKKTITSLRKSLDKILEAVESKERSMMKKKENSL